MILPFHTLATLAALASALTACALAVWWLPEAVHCGWRRVVPAVERGWAVVCLVALVGVCGLVDAVRGWGVRG